MMVFVSTCWLDAQRLCILHQGGCASAKRAASHGPQRKNPPRQGVFGQGLGFRISDVRCVEGCWGFMVNTERIHCALFLIACTSAFGVKGWRDCKIHWSSLGVLLEGLGVSRGCLKAFGLRGFWRWSAQGECLRSASQPFRCCWPWLKSCQLCATAARWENQTIANKSCITARAGSDRFSQT